MKRRDHRKSQMKHQLEERRNRRIPEVVWKLDKEQCEIIDELGYARTPYIYKAITRPFHNIRMIRHSLVRDVHYAYKRGQKALYFKPKDGDLKILEEYDIRYCPYKYQIILR